MIVIIVIVVRDSNSLDAVDRGVDVVLVVELAQGELGAEGGGEGVHAHLHVVGTDVKIGAHVLDELQHLVEVLLSHAARLVQQEHDVRLTSTVCQEKEFFSTFLHCLVY